MIRSATLLVGVLFGSLSGPAAPRAQADCTTTTFPSVDVPKSIPSPPGIVESEVIVTESGPVDDLNVQLDITHPFDSDLTIELLAPSEEAITLAEGVGTWGDDFTDPTFDDEAPGSIVSALPPFAGSFRPQQPLSGLEGGSRTGTWKLRVTDRHAGFDGTLESWSIEVGTCTDLPPQQPPEAGAPPLPPLPAGFPAESEEILGTLITVTTASDLSDGDTSSVANLEASPGPDGEISLREAITATNSDPGTYTVRFDPGLAGNTITAASSLPELRGGGVFIDGDIDGDGDADVTVAGSGPLFGLVVSSSHNRLHALAIRDFTIAGVVLCPGPDCAAPANDQILADNTLSALSIEGIDQAIIQNGSQQGPENTNNRWVDTRIVGNRIDAEGDGIGITLFGSTGDEIERFTVAGNSIDIDEDGSDAGGFAVGVASGGGPDSDDDRVSEALLAHNAIAGTPEGAFFLDAAGAGDIPGIGSVIEDVKVVDNRVQLEPGQHATTGFGTSGISVFAGDDFDPSEDALVRRIEVRHNLVEGYGRAGLSVVAGCCGAIDGAVEDVSIEGNSLHGVLLPRFVPGPQGIFHRGIAISGGADAGNEVRGVNVVHNTIMTANPEGVETAEFLAAGLLIEGGLEGPANGAEDVLVERNLIDTELIGISLIGGLATPDLASGNHVHGVTARENVVVQEPTLLPAAAPGVKGISIVGGTGPLDPGSGPWEATGNAVSCIKVDDNLVAGLLDDFSIFDDLGAGASDNSVTFAGCGGNDFPVQFSVGDYSVPESAGRATITVTRSAGAGPGGVDYATSDGTAGSADYQPSSGTLSFDAGETSATFDVQVTHDAVAEPSETVNLTLSSASGDARLGAPRRAVLTIEDSPPPTPPPPPPDTAAPETVIDRGPGRKRTKRGKAKFIFHADDPGARFECRLKGRKATRDQRRFKPCASPKKYRKLRRGRYVFFVRAIDAAGNTDATPAKKRFKARRSAAPRLARIDLPPCLAVDEGPIILEPTATIRPLRHDGDTPASSSDARPAMKAGVSDDTPGSDDSRSSAWALGRSRIRGEEASRQRASGA